MPRLNSKIIIWIIVSGMVLGLLFNWLNQKGISLAAREKTINWKNTSLSVPTNSNEPYAVNLTQAKELYDEDHIFIDARDKEDYEAGHIKGAINIPFDDLDNYIRKLSLIKKDKTIVTYCNGTECDLSLLLGSKLSEMGYKNVYIFFGGWNKWIDAGFPVETSLKK